MGLESGTYVSDFVTTNPVGATDKRSQGDDHLRLIKSVLKTTFPNASAPLYFPTILSKSANYTVLQTDDGTVILCDASGGSFTLSLTAVATLTSRFRFSVVKTDSSANTVTIDPNGAETIDGASTYVLRKQYESVMVVNNATAFFTVGKLQIGLQSIWIPAGAMTTRTTNGAATGTLELTTNKNMVRTLDFDSSTQEFAQFDIRMPKSWNESTVSFIPVWSHPATTTNFGVVWGLDAVAVSDDDAMDVAFGTAQTSTDTGGTTNDSYQGPECSAITISGSPAVGDLVMFRIHRDPANGSDTMAVDARLHGILLLYTIDTLRDD